MITHHTESSKYKKKSIMTLNPSNITSNKISHNISKMYIYAVQAKISII
jgi:hypothetical protein